MSGGKSRKGVEIRVEKGTLGNDGGSEVMVTASKKLRRAAESLKPYSPLVQAGPSPCAAVSLGRISAPYDPLWSGRKTGVTLGKGRVSECLGGAVNVFSCISVESLLFFGFS